MYSSADQSCYRFVFLTKTFWSEPPRIRHQLARLVAQAGHRVLFFEKPRALWIRRKAERSVERGIEVSRHGELLHHKLRVGLPLHQVNAFFTRRSVASEGRRFGIGSQDVILNFNYDYYFLREAFPRSRLITMINDDFVSRALFGWTGAAQEALARTCHASDRVLTVSRPLQQQLQPYCTPELFLPWADQPYRLPAENAGRRTLLFWGFINNRLDFELVQKVAGALLQRRSEIRIKMVGPLEAAGRSGAASLSRLSNVEIMPATKLDSLPLDEVLAAFLPYREGVPSIDAIMLPNKALQLLARGLPLLISGMPHFIEAPFVRRIDSTAPLDAIERLRDDFRVLQHDISHFVAENGPDARLRQLMSPLGTA